jgi:hypothetical protein
VEDYDVVLGTHGRGFWILDDIDPLRQMTPDVYDAPLKVFEPHRGVRGVENAAIQYMLRDPVEKVTVEILDSEGNVIRTESGTPEDESKPPPPPSFRAPPPPPPTVHAGLNRFEWDLRYPGATDFEGMIIWSARPTRGPKAPPGRYQARVTTGDHTQTVSFDVVMDPRLKGVTSEDLQEQFELASQIRDKTSTANEAVIRIREIRDQVNDRMEGSADERLQSSAKSLLDKMAEIEQELYQVKNRSNQDPLNFPIKLNNRLASLRRSVENGDARPTDGAYKVFEELSAELEGHLRNLASVLDTDLPAVNRELERLNLKEVQSE